MIQPFNPLSSLMVATALEVSGDAIVRIAIYERQGAVRLGVLVVGGTMIALGGPTVSSWRPE